MSEQNAGAPSRISHRELVFGELRPLPKSDWHIVDLLSEIDGENYRAALKLPPKEQSSSSPEGRSNE